MRNNLKMMTIMLLTWSTIHNTLYPYDNLQRQMGNPKRLNLTVATKNHNNYCHPSVFQKIIIMISLCHSLEDSLADRQCRQWVLKIRVGPHLRRR